MPTPLRLITPFLSFTASRFAGFYFHEKTFPNLSMGAGNKIQRGGPSTSMGLGLTVQSSNDQARIIVPIPIIN